MKTQLSLALLLLCCLNTKAQNRIPNPSFEDYNTDCTAGGMTTSNVWGWAHPQCAQSGGYYNVCFDATMYFESSVPTNFSGYANPVEGDAYMSIQTFGEGVSSELGNPRSFRTVALWEPLEANEPYCIRLWASLKDNSSYKTSDLHCMLGVDTPNACLMSSLQWADDAQVILNTSDVDTAGWTQLEGTFVATGGESTLTIGDFHLGAYLDTVRIRDDLSPVYAGYYIDLVYLGPCDNALPKNNREHGLWLYPSPATTNVQVTLDRSVTNATIEVIDAQGKVQLAQRMIGKQHVLDVSALSNGLYHLRVTQGHEYFLSSFTVQH